MMRVMPSASATRQACCPPAPPEARQRIGANVVTARHGDLLDRIRHIVDRDRHKPFGNRQRIEALPGRRLHFVSKPQEFFLDDVHLEGQITLRTEYLGKHPRLKLSRHDVAIGDRQRTATTITGRPRIGSRRFRTHPKAIAIEAADGAAAGRHRMDVHHGRT